MALNPSVVEEGSSRVEVAGGIECRGANSAPLRLIASSDGRFAAGSRVDEPRPMTLPLPTQTPLSQQVLPSLHHDIEPATMDRFVAGHMCGVWCFTAW
jgi:hypothetical protein